MRYFGVSGYDWEIFSKCHFSKGKKFEINLIIWSEKIWRKYENLKKRWTWIEECWDKSDDNENDDDSDYDVDEADDDDNDNNEDSDDDITIITSSYLSITMTMTVMMTLLSSE